MKKEKLVLGFGVSGKAVVSYLLAQGERPTVLDKRAAELQSDPLAQKGVKLFPDRADFSLEGFDHLILSPGVPLIHPIVERAALQGIETIGEIEFAFRHIKNRCVGVTGTNGKTTTALLTTHVLNSAGIKACSLGNIGESLTSYLEREDREEILVVELSSFQLDTMRSECLEAAVLLNITPDHLDRYASMREYAISKLSIEKRVFEGGKCFISEKIRDEYSSLLVGDKWDFFDREEIESVAPISPIGYIQKGIPEKENVQAAFKLSSHFGVAKGVFLKGLETFRKPSHRIEWVGEAKGVSYYDDSKATNIDSVMHALKLFQGPLLLIVGGVDKGASYKPWIEVFKGKVKKIFAYGEAASKMEEELSSHFPFKKVKAFQDAFESAFLEAKEKETVLLSPGCSSFDQFKSYAHRGDEFKRLLKEKMR
ncbi:MAG: UDP-N-acetylmuramoylalanine--D-glutamate ligase [Chlamydiae bacterium RIFCSPHIGHO2_12_FULL_49_9]|nr:MAG: UDP-N-acetylmuramoylalanine--D-glutamate ligase [Chlamydiae bacterium RIFCSPHIGHO2_12_FULL_49_9]